MKTNTFKRWTATTLAAAGLLALSQTASAVPVDLELSLVVDTSGSISSTEFKLQQTGYANAFKNAAVANFIQQLGDAGTGGIAVNTIFFNSTSAQRLGWTQLQTAADSIAFGNALAGLSRNPPNGVYTNIANGMETSVNSFTNNFEGKRLTMDVSGDGKQNRVLDGSSSCTLNCTTLVTTQRAAAEAAGIKVNGLAIGSSSIKTYYENYVKTTTGFVVAANDFGVFEKAVLKKILREIKGSPEPGILMLLSIGLLGMGLGKYRRRR